jgi:hypothetical protein
VRCIVREAHASVFSVIPISPKGRRALLVFGDGVFEHGGDKILRKGRVVKFFSGKTQKNPLVREGFFRFC